MSLMSLLSMMVTVVGSDKGFLVGHGSVLAVGTYSSEPDTTKILKH